MIGRLQGILLEKQAGEVLLDVNGVAYEVEVTDSTWHQLPDLGQGTVLFTHFVVREDAQQLYGFSEREDRTLFRLLIKVNGVGPKLALGLLSGMGSSQFAACVARNDIAALVKLPGVGKKTAERLLIEMRDKLKDWQPQGGSMAAASADTRSAAAATDEAEGALVSLGYKPQEATRAVMSAIAVMEEEGKEVQTEQIIRIALKNLGKA